MWFIPLQVVEVCVLIAIIVLLPVFRYLCRGGLGTPRSIADWPDFYGRLLGAAFLSLIWPVWVPPVVFHKTVMLFLGTSPTKAAATLSHLDPDALRPSSRKQISRGAIPMDDSYWD